MVTTIPKGVYTMKDRMSIIKQNAALYRKSNKKQKSIILDELTSILHLSRKHLAFLLRNTGKTIYIRGKKVILDLELTQLSNRGRKKTYTEELIKPLLEVWRYSGYISSKHLVTFIRLNEDKLSSLLERLTPDVREKILKISASTVDRLLKPVRDRMRLKSKYKRNPFSSNLKRSIEVESWFDKPKIYGYVEIDLVHHSGVSGKGDFIYTLTATEITRGWTELRALKNKAMTWTSNALKDIKKSMPVKIREIHSDNGSEFINAHIQRLCKEEGIKFTRSRPYRKNDAPYVESKNWSLVRAYTGWRRYDTEEEYKVLDKLLRLVSLRHNLFIPTMKLNSRERIGGKIKRSYNMNIPFNRVIEVGETPKESKEDLERLRDSIDLMKLSLEIEELTAELDQIYERKVKRYSHE